MATRYISVKSYLSQADIGCQQADIAVSMLTLVAIAYYKLRSLKQANTGCRSLDPNHVGVRHSSMRDVKYVQVEGTNQLLEILHG